MAKTGNRLMVTEELVTNKIYVIRGMKVMLDEDLAELYQVETKRLNEQVKRNSGRFPGDFMFRLSQKEFENLKSQFATSSWGGRRKTPLAFTEQGVSMLSSVLNSETAIRVNIEIIRVFTRMRGLLLANKEILLHPDCYREEKKLTGHDKDIALIFECLKKLLHSPQPPRQRIGFKRKNED